MTYQEQRAKVSTLQKQISVLNNRLCGEFDTLRTPFGRENIAAERDIVVQEWNRELRVMHSMPEYTGIFKA